MTKYKLVFYRHINYNYFKAGPFISRTLGNSKEETGDGSFNCWQKGQG